MNSKLEETKLDVKQFETTKIERYPIGSNNLDKWIDIFFKAFKLTL